MSENSLKYISEIYLDNNATTQVLPEVAATMTSALCQQFGNPSSAHSAGDRSRDILYHARKQVGSLIGCEPESILFTGSGTQANNIILASAARWSANPTIVTTSVEHSSVLAMCDHLDSQGCQVVILPVNPQGLINLSDLRTALEKNVSLVSIQWVNNETGVIQPIKEIADICQDAGVPFHTDAAQAVGKLNFDVTKLPIDFLTLTGHKFHAPQGIAAIYGKDLRKLRPLFFGGNQENGLYPGTENVAGIAGLGCAATIRRKELAKTQTHIEALRDRFENAVLECIPGTRINGGSSERICNTVNVMFDDLDGQALIARLDQAGIRCSQTSACTNQLPEPSYVLRAMGLSEKEAFSSIRFSFSVLNSTEEVDAAVRTLVTLCERLRNLKF